MKPPEDCDANEYKNYLIKEFGKHAPKLSLVSEIRYLNLELKSYLERIFDCMDDICCSKDVRERDKFMARGIISEIDINQKRLKRLVEIGEKLYYKRKH